MPSSKKERSKKKKAGKRSVSPAVDAAAARLKAANAVAELSSGVEAFLSIDLPAAKGVVTAGKCWWEWEYLQLLQTSS